MNYRLINGFRINSFQSAEDLIENVKNKKKILIAMNAEKIINENQRLKTIINSNISYPDGEGCVMALKQKGLSSAKISGSKLWIKIISKLQNTHSFYFVGSSEDVINATIRKLRKNFLNLNIVGFRNGFLNESEKMLLIKDLQKKSPDIIFVAQGSPRQEILMDELIKSHPALYMGLGGSFEVYSGKKKDAPRPFVNFKIEWLYRIFLDPLRIKRLPKLFKFGYLFLTKKL